MTTQPANDPSVKSSAYAIMDSCARLPDALMGGTRAMRLAGTEFLPKEPGETEQAYNNRLSRSVLFNGYRRTIQYLLGKPFNKAVQPTDIPTDWESWLENIDRGGRDITQFSVDLCRDSLNRGISWIYVDYPRAAKDATTGQPRARSIAEERDQDIRPYFVHVKQRQMLGVRYHLADGKPVIDQARWMEWTCEPDGPFGESNVKRVRVIVPGGWQLYREATKSGTTETEWVLEDQGTTSLAVVPLVAVYSNRTHFFEAEPPMMDLADLNAAHWQSASDQRHILHVARVPILFGKMLGEDKAMLISPNSLYNAQAPEADLKYVEHTGKAIEAGAKDLEQLEDRMSAMGADFLVTGAGQPDTATGEILDAGQNDSALGWMVGNWQDGIEAAWQLAGQYEKKPADAEIGGFTINKDFGISQRDKSELDAILRARLGGEISRERFLEEYKRRGVFPDDMDVPEEMARIEEEGLNMPQSGAGGGGETQPGGPGNDTQPGNPGNDTMAGGAA